MSLNLAAASAAGHFQKMNGPAGFATDFAAGNQPLPGKPEARQRKRVDGEQNPICRHLRAQPSRGHAVPNADLDKTPPILRIASQAILLGRRCLGLRGGNPATPEQEMQSRAVGNAQSHKVTRVEGTDMERRFIMPGRTMRLSIRNVDATSAILRDEVESAAHQFGNCRIILVAITFVVKVLAVD